MRIFAHLDSTQKITIGYTLWLSANDTWKWARRPGKSWPCSQLSNKRFMVYVDDNGLCDFTLNGKSGDCDGNELDACVSDHLPAAYRHLWPTWEPVKQKPKWVPEKIMTLHGIRPVIRCESFPAGQALADCPIRPDMVRVKVTADNGDYRWFGFDHAEIDSYLRMKVSGYNPGFEEVTAWEDAKE